MDHSGFQSTMSWDLRQLVDSARRDFLVALSESKDSPIESFLQQIPESARSMLLADLIAIELHYRRERGEHPELNEYISRFPEEAEWLNRHFASLIDSSEIVQSTRPDLDQRLNRNVPPVAQSVPILDRYQPLERLGRGGFGVVWRARDTLLNRFVAIKKLRVDRQFNDLGSQLLLKEGQRLAQLDHPNIVRVIDAGLTGNEFFLVSELMPGGTLEEWLDQHSVSIEQAARWTATLAHALHHAHSRGLVHRDIKPSNILFDAEGEPHLADFGLAASEEELSSESPQALGSIQYMPPEQARGESHLADPRSDVYSLGMVLYRLLTGRLPYTAKSGDEYRREILTREPRPLRVVNSEIPPLLEALCLKCLKKEISQRPATALELAEGLEAWLQQSSTIPPKARSINHPAGRILAGGILVVLLVVVVFKIQPKELSSLKPALHGVQHSESLLNPELISWLPYDTHDSHGYSDDRHCFEFDAFGHALFRTGEHSAEPHTFVSDFTLNRSNGMAGVFWCLSSSPDGVLHCWSVFAGRLDTNNKPTVCISEYAIGATAGGRQGVIEDKVHWHLPLEAQTSGHVVMRIKATADEVSEVWINGNQILPTPFTLPKVSWNQGTKFGTGFGGQLGEVAVFQNVVE